MTMAAHDSSARWRTFLTEAKEDDILLILSKQSSPYLDIPFHELQAFDPEFAEDVLQHPRQILDRGSQTLVEICRERGEDIDAMLRVGELPRDSRRNLRDIGTADIERLRSVEVISQRSPISSRGYTLRYSLARLVGTQSRSVRRTRGNW